MKPFEKGKKILQIFSNLGQESYFVGGALRDYILKRAFNDIDIATPLRPEEVMNIFPKTVPIGLKHGTVLVLFEGDSFEVTTFRTEGTYKDFRHPDEVHFVTDIREDLSRRDFTINAMAMNLYGEIFDPFGGQNDIRNKQVRAVGDAAIRFSEDPLRILRAFRFCSQLGFRLEEKTKQAAYEKTPLLRHISVERIQVEMEKLLCGKDVQKIWFLLDEANIASVIPLGQTEHQWAELASYNFSQLDKAEEKWAALYFLLNISNSKQELMKWKFSNQKRNEIETLLNWVRIKGADMLTPFEIYTLGLEYACCVASIQSMCCHREKTQALQVVKDIWQHLPIQTREDIYYDGKQILAYTGEKGGPWVGELLKDLERAIVERTCANQVMEIEGWVEIWLQKYKKKC